MVVIIQNGICGFFCFFVICSAPIISKPASYDLFYDTVYFMYLSLFMINVYVLVCHIYKIESFKISFKELCTLKHC